MKTLLWQGVVEAHYVGDTPALLASVCSPLGPGFPLPAVRCVIWRPLRGWPDRRLVEVEL